MDIRFDDHPSFHRAAIGMVGSSLAFGLVLHPFAAWPVSPIAAGLLGIAAGAAFAHGRAAWRMLAGIAASAPLVVAVNSSGVIGAPAVALTCGALALGIGIGGLRGIKGLFALGLAMATTAMALWCATKFATASAFAGMPSMLHDGMTATAMGIVGTFAMLPRHLRFAIDPVATAVRNLPPNLDAEVRNLCDRSVAIWNTTKTKLADNDPGKALVRDGVVKTLEVAAKSNDTKLTGASDADLAARMADFDKRIEAATDAEVKGQYQQARAALDDQRRYRAAIRQGRERLVARLHNHVTTLEKFQLAATGLEAQRASQTTATTQLDELSQSVAASGEALAEIELGDAGAPTIADTLA
ncbi:MAG TPA: hypothetical protein VGM90_06875 [Kofleriaceae bacterium]|jgi:hypothetical protein